MPSSFLSSPASSSHLAYLIPASRPPPPPPLIMVQGYGANGVVGVPAASAAEAVVALAPPPPPRQGSGHPPLPRPPPRQCPRCGSANTKFCYYNNYSREQPRYLCKACRRHWTEGGTLRDVPVGGGRKSRRGSKGADAAAKASASTAPAGAAALFPDLLRQLAPFQPPAGLTGGGYSIDLSAWMQMAAATAPPQGTAGTPGGTAAADTNCGALQYWSDWQQDDMPSLDGGAC